MRGPADIGRARGLGPLFALVVLCGCSLTRDYDQVRPPGRWTFEPRWLRSIGSPSSDDARACAIDDDGDVRVAGRARAGASADGLGSIVPDDESPFTTGYVLRYGAAGDGVASFTLTGDSTTGVGDLVVAGSDEYLVGFFVGNLDLGGDRLTSTSGLDVLVVRRDQTGEAVWATHGSGVGASVGMGIDVRDGRVAVTGSFGRNRDDTTDDFAFPGCASETSTGGSTGFVALLNDDGGCQWTRYVEADGSDQASRVDIGAPPAGVIAVGGRTGGLPLEQPGGHDFWLGGFDSQGDRQWHLNPESSGFAEAVDVAVTTQAACAVGRTTSVIELDDGEPLDPGSSLDALITCRSPGTGEKTWTRAMGSTATARLDGIGILGELVVAGGTFDGSLELEEGDQLDATGISAGLLTAFDGDSGELAGLASFGGGGSVLIRDLAVADGTVCLTGTYQGRLIVGDDVRDSADDSTDAFLAVFDLVPP